MEVFDTPDGVRAWSERRRRDGHRVALVPTMGALHDGHRALISAARRHADSVVVSIFVNPLQFDRRDDFDRYPRPVDDDLARCREAGVDAVYAPTAAVMYPARYETHVEPGALAVPLEGAHRPGHFRGVTTVVAKLFGAVRPDVAIFGEKDAQQLAVVRRMALDLDTGIEIVAVPTVREADGLALSSRNRRLSGTDRAAAACIPRALDAAGSAVGRGETSARAVADLVGVVVGSEPRARLEYAAVVDADSFDDVERIGPGALLAVAVWIGDVRLIDNRRLGG